MSFPWDNRYIWSESFSWALSSFALHSLSSFPSNLQLLSHSPFRPPRCLHHCNEKISTEASLVESPMNFVLPSLGKGATPGLSGFPVFHGRSLPMIYSIGRKDHAVSFSSSFRVIYSTEYIRVECSQRLVNTRWGHGVRPFPPGPTDL